MNSVRNFPFVHTFVRARAGAHAHVHPPASKNEPRGLIFGSVARAPEVILFIEPVYFFVIFGGIKIGWGFYFAGIILAGVCAHSKAQAHTNAPSHVHARTHAHHARQRRPCPGAAPARRWGWELLCRDWEGAEDQRCPPVQQRARGKESRQQESKKKKTDDGLQ